MYHYKIYGLNISSSRKINLLKEQKPIQNPDLSVKWKIGTEKTPDNSLNWKHVHSEMLKLFTGISMWENEMGAQTKVRFELEEGRALSFVFDAACRDLGIFHHSKESRSDLESYLVGPALGFIMRLRGIVCLHSSVVAFDSHAIALIGYSTAGKSTTAAGLAEAGAKVLADDIAVLTPCETGFSVQPGYSKIRLRPKAADFLISDPSELRIVYSNRDSRYVDLNEKFDVRALPLSAIYLLGNVSDDYRNPFIEPVRSKEKLIKLLQNTYGSYVVQEKLRANEFRILSQIANEIPMRKLHYAHDIKTLPKQCELIFEDFRKLQEAHEQSFVTKL